METSLRKPGEAPLPQRKSSAEQTWTPIGGIQDRHMASVPLFRPWGAKPASSARTSAAIAGSDLDQPQVSAREAGKPTGRKTALIGKAGSWAGLGREPGQQGNWRLAPSWNAVERMRSQETPR